jgi:hypothetical protein
MSVIRPVSCRYPTKIIDVLATWNSPLLLTTLPICSPPHMNVHTHIIASAYPSMHPLIFQSHSKVPEAVYYAKLWQNCIKRFVRIGRPTCVENNAEGISGGGANTSYRLVPFLRNYSVSGGWQCVCFRTTGLRAQGCAVTSIFNAAPTTVKQRRRFESTRAVSHSGDRLSQTVSI